MAVSTVPVSASSMTTPILRMPPLSLPMRHFAFAAISFWVFAVSFLIAQESLLGFSFNAFLWLGTVHVLTLGWITMTMLGVMVQMATVLWETSLRGQGWIRAGWWLMAVGIVVLVGAFWVGTSWYALPAYFLAIPVIFYLGAMIRTMWNAPKLDWTGFHMAWAMGYLIALVTVAVLLASDRHRGTIFHDPDGALIAHIHLALVGWVSLTIMGASYKLVSMFALAHTTSRTAGRIAFGLGNVGLIGLAVDALFLGRRWMPFWSIVLGVAYLAYLSQMREIFSVRHRRLDPSLSFTLLALAGGAMWVGLGLGLAFGWLEDTTETRAAYVFSVLVGWVTPFILGQIHKIAPFLVWTRLFQSNAWKGSPPPRVQDLTSERLAWATFGALGIAIASGLVGLLGEIQWSLRACGMSLVLCATCYLLNAWNLVHHIHRSSLSLGGRGVG